MKDEGIAYNVSGCHEGEMIIWCLSCFVNELRTGENDGPVVRHGYLKQTTLVLSKIRQVVLAFLEA